MTRLTDQDVSTVMGANPLPPPHVHIEPPASAWLTGLSREFVCEESSTQHCTGGERDAAGSASSLLEICGYAPLDSYRPVIATGHQTWHWHPGILAKYFAAVEVAKRVGGQVLNIWIDQDPTPALHLEVPVEEVGRLSVDTVELADLPVDVPIGVLPPVDVNQIVEALGMKQTSRVGGGPESPQATYLATDLKPLIEAWQGAASNASPWHGKGGGISETLAKSTLADQVGDVLLQLMRPYTGPIASVKASQLMNTPQAHGWIDRMMSDAPSCVAAYNTAARRYPEARVATLRVELDRVDGPPRVELPLWWIGKNPARPLRQRVFVELGQDPPRLILEDGQPVTWPVGHIQSHTRIDGLGLAPRALLLTALVRTYFCDLFIHGRGGGHYDQVMELWWEGWLGSNVQLAPRVTVSADAYLPFDAPVVDEYALQRAQWRVAHLPHNVDRALDISVLNADERALINRKRDLLTHMNDDRDRGRRFEAFNEIHQINAKLAHAHSGLLEQAQRELDRCRLGVMNRTVAGKRDWCFGLYPPSQLSQLQELVNRSFDL